jgi:hypothetical protein
MKLRPFATLNHFTVPVSSTTVSEDGPSDISARKLDRRGAGAAVLLSTLSTSVTCGPFVTWADTHFESFARLDSADPALTRQAPMKKGVA